MSESVITQESTHKNLPRDADGALNELKRLCRLEMERHQVVAGQFIVHRSDEVCTRFLAECGKSGLIVLTVFVNKEWNGRMSWTYCPGLAL